jgi:hypothetical protein
MWTDPFIDFWGILLDPSEDRRVIHIESTFLKHLFDIMIGKLITAISALSTKLSGSRRVDEGAWPLYRPYNYLSLGTEVCSRD